MSWDNNVHVIRNDPPRVEVFRFDNYQPPIEVTPHWSEAIKKITKQTDEAYMEVVMSKLCSLDVEVNRDELLKALQYDRDQYNKGYRDGLNANPPVKHGRWHNYTQSRYYGTDEYGEPIFRDGCVVWVHRKCGWRSVIKTPYCLRCGAMLDEEASE